MICTIHRQKIKDLDTVFDAFESYALRTKDEFGVSVSAADTAAPTLESSLAKELYRARVVSVAGLPNTRGREKILLASTSHYCS